MKNLKNGVKSTTDVNEVDFSNLINNNFLSIDSVSTKSFENLNNLDLDVNFLSHKKN
jgi:hypothetical protein